MVNEKFPEIQEALEIFIADKSLYFADKICSIGINLDEYSDSSKCYLADAILKKMKSHFEDLEFFPITDMNMGGLSVEVSHK